MAVTTKAVYVAIAAVVLQLHSAYAADDEKWIALGETISGGFTNKSDVYQFRGVKDDIVTIRLEGKDAEQIGVVLNRSDKDLDFEWITPSVYDRDTFKASGNVRDGNTLRLSLRLPMTAQYSIHLGSKMGIPEGTESPFKLTVESNTKRSGKVYVRGTAAYAITIVSNDATPYGANATLAVGQMRRKDMGVEGFLSGTIIPADTFTAMALLGIAARIYGDQGSPFIGRFGAGVAGMTGLADQLGGGLRMDLQAGKFGFGAEGARLGRANVLMTSFGFAF